MNLSTAALSFSSQGSTAIAAAGHQDPQVLDALLKVLDILPEERVSLPMLRERMARADDADLRALAESPELFWALNAHLDADGQVSRRTLGEALTRAEGDAPEAGGNDASPAVYSVRAHETDDLEAAVPDFNWEPAPPQAEPAPPANIAPGDPVRVGQFVRLPDLAQNDPLLNAAGSSDPWSSLEVREDGEEVDHTEALRRQPGWPNYYEYMDEDSAAGAVNQSLRDSKPLGSVEGKGYQDGIKTASDFVRDVLPIAMDVPEGTKMKRVLSGEVSFGAAADNNAVQELIENFATGQIGRGAVLQDLGFMSSTPEYSGIHHEFKDQWDIHFDFVAGPDVKALPMPSEDWTNDWQEITLLPGQSFAVQDVTLVKVYDDDKSEVPKGTEGTDAQFGEDSDGRAYKTRAIVKAVLLPTDTDALLKELPAPSHVRGSDGQLNDVAWDESKTTGMFKDEKLGDRGVILNSDGEALVGNFSADGNKFTADQPSEDLVVLGNTYTRQVSEEGKVAWVQPGLRGGAAEPPPGSTSAEAGAPEPPAPPAESATPREKALFEIDEANYWKSRALSALGGEDAVATETEGALQTVHFRDDAGGVGTAQVRYDEATDTASYERWLVDKEGKVTHEKGVLANQGKSPDLQSDPSRFTQPKAGELSSMEGVTQAVTRVTERDSASDAITIADTRARDGETATTTTTRIESLNAEEASARLEEDKQHRGGALPPDAAQSFSIDTESETPVELVTVTQSAPGKESSASAETKTYTQKQTDGGSVSTTLGKPSGAEDSTWSQVTQSADGKTTTEKSFFGKDGRMERKAELMEDGSTRETIDTQAPSEIARSMPDAAWTHTERTSGPGKDGSLEIHEQTWRGDSQENAREGAAGLAYSAKKDMTVTEWVGEDGVARTTETGASEVLDAGKKTSVNTSTVTAHRADGDAVESMTQEATNAAGTTARSVFEAGHEPVYSVRQSDGEFVPLDGEGGTEEERRAVADLRLASVAALADVAAKKGGSAVAELVAGEADALREAAERADFVDTRLEALGAGAAEGAVNRGFAAAGGALSVYEGVMVLVSLPDAIRSGDAYGIGQAATGLAASAAELTDLAVGGASLASSAGALKTLGSVAGKVSGVLGSVALGMEVPNLAEAIKNGDTKAIVNSAVNLGGGVAAIVAGSAMGGPAGLAMGLLIGGGVAVFSEIWNAAFNQGTPLTGPDPLTASDQKTRTELLGHLQSLHNEWDSLGEDPGAGKFEEWAQPDSGKSEAVRAASQFFADHPEFVNWLDAAGTGDLRERDASYHGNISKADLTRYMIHVAVPPEVFNSLPPPSQDARLWAAGVIHDNFGLLNAFGKDGNGMGAGDADIGLPELLNVASGFYDESLRARIQGEGDHLIELYDKFGIDGPELEQLEAQYQPDAIQERLDNLKKACAYVGLNPSEASFIDTVRTGSQDNQLAPADFEKIYTENRDRIEELLREHPSGMPTFNELADENRALGNSNPALWRPDRWYQENADAPASVWQTLLDNREKIAALDWAGLTRAREQALQEGDYALYYAVDSLMALGGDLFLDRGEGQDLALSWSDIEQKSEAQKAAASGQPIEEPQHRYHYSAREESTDPEYVGDESIELTADDKVFLDQFIADNELDMENEEDSQRLEEAFRERYYPHDEAFRPYVELDVSVVDSGA